MATLQKKLNYLYGMEAFNSYYDFLNKVSIGNRSVITKDDSIDWRHELERGKYAKHSREANPGMYVLDLTTQKYLFVNDMMASFADVSIADLLKGGLKLALKLWHPADLNTYDKMVLPINLKYFREKKIPVSEYSDYFFTCNYRVRHRDGHYIQIEQTSFFNNPYEDGTPLRIIGFLRNISNRHDSSVMIHTIEKVHRGDNIMIARFFHYPNREQHSLTEREIEILSLIITGLKSSDIAEILGITKSTIDNHRKNMLRKTGSKNMEQIVAYAIKKGL